MVWAPHIRFGAVSISGLVNVSVLSVSLVPTPPPEAIYGLSPGLS